MDAGAKKLLLTIDEVGPMGGGDMIYERSHYCFYKSDGSVFDQGKYARPSHASIVLCLCVGITNHKSFVSYHKLDTVTLIINLCILDSACASLEGHRRVSA